MIRVLLEATDQFIESFEFPSATTLWQVLEAMETMHEKNFTHLYGTPPVEQSSFFEVHIHVKGYMQPVVKTDSFCADSTDALQSTKLQDLCSDKKEITLTLTHQYVPPERTDEDKAKSIEKFQKLMEQAQQYTGEKQDKVHTGPNQLERNIKCYSKELTTTMTRKPIVLPEEDEDEFFKMSKEDMKHYMDSIRNTSKINATSNRITKKPTDLTRIRFRLFPRYFIEGTFMRNECVGDLYTFIRRCLKKNYGEILKFELYLAPPKMIIKDDDKMLGVLGLVPSGLVNVSWFDKTLVEGEEIVKDELK